MTQQTFSTAVAEPAHRLGVSDLRHAYGNIEVLRGVSLDIAPGEILCLAGPSGCGKSTLLRLIAGLELVQSGSIRIDGECVGAAHIHLPPERRGVGLVFQDFALFPHMSILDNVAFGLGSMDHRRRRETALAMLEQVGLADRAAQLPHVLSGGQQQRVAVARALASRPRLILLDEPFSNLDVRLRHRLRTETQQLLKGSGISSIMVTHDPEEAMFMADHIALMDRGRIVQFGTPAQIYRHPASSFTAEFFGDVNRFYGTVAAGVVMTPFGPLPAAGFPPGRRVEVLIRPEAIRVAGADDGLVKGVVKWARYLGAASLVGLQLPAGAAVADAQEVQALLPGELHPPEMSILKVNVDPVGVFMFPADEAAGRD